MEEMQEGERTDGRLDRGRHPERKSRPDRAKFRREIDQAPSRPPIRGAHAAGAAVSPAASRPPFRSRGRPRPRRHQSESARYGELNLRGGNSGVPDCGVKL